MRTIGAVFVLAVALLSAVASADGSVVEVVGRRPEGAVVSIADAATITVIFDSPVVPIGGIPSSPVREGPFIIDPPIEGTYHFLGTRTVEFRPDGPLPRSTLFTVRLLRDLPTLDHVRLEDVVEWSFETPRPRVAACSLDGMSGWHEGNPIARWVAPDTDIYLWFDQPVDVSSAAHTVRLARLCRSAASGDTCAGGERASRDLRRGSWQFRHATDEEFAKEVAGREDSRQWTRIARVSRDESDRRALVVLDLTDDLDMGTIYRIVVHAGIVGAEGPLASTDDGSLTFWTRREFCFAGLRGASVTGAGALCTGPEPGSGTHNPDFSFTAVFSNPVDQRAFANALTFDPSVDIPDDVDAIATDTPRLWISLEASTEYAVAIRETLADIFGNRLGRPTSFTFRTGDHSPFVEIVSGYRVVERYRSHSLPVDVINPNPLRLRMARIAPGDVVQFCQRDTLFYRTKHLTPDAVVNYAVDRPFQPEVSRNVRACVPVDLDEVLRGMDAGIVFVELSERDGDRMRYRKALIQVTNLGVTGKIALNRTLVWVTNLDAGHPIEGAGVEIRDDENRLLWRGQTGEEGLVEGPGWLELSRERDRDETLDGDDLWVIVQKNDDTAFIAPDHDFGIQPYRFHLRYDASPDPIVLRASVFTDQGIYRTGDEVRVKGIVRTRGIGDEWSIPQEMRFRISVVDYRRETVHRETLGVNYWGAFDFVFRLDPGASLGYYSILADTLASESGEWERCPGFHAGFRVEAFRPAEFEVDVRPDREQYVRGDTCALTISGRYLFGGAMQGAEIAWYARIAPTSYTPPGFEDYRFGSFVGIPRGRGGSVLGSKRELLDDSGKLDVSMTLETGTHRSSVTMTAGATVTSPSRQEVSEHADVIVHPGLYHVGIRPQTTLAEAASSVAFNLVTITSEGEAVPGREITVRVVHRQWHSVRKAATSGRYRWVTETEDTLVDSVTVVSSADSLTLETTPAAAGFYVIIAESVDERGNRIVTECPFYASGAGYAAWARRNDDSIELVADAGSYEPGQTARILVKSPYERARALVSVERGCVMSFWTEELVGTAPEIEIPLTEEHLPNVYVSVILVSGRTGGSSPDDGSEDLGKPALKIGYVELLVDPGSNHLTVDVVSDRETYRPGDTVTLSLDVSRAGGQAARAEVTVAVVNLGVLNLTGHRLPDPFDRFYSRQPLSVKTLTLYRQIVEQLAYGEKGESRSGDGGGDAAFGVPIRGDFKTSAYWNPSLVTDVSGRAEVSFRLPDNLTTWQVMAVAHTREGEFGFDESPFRVAKPFMLQSSLPRFARCGDRFNGGVVAHNQTDAPGEVTVRASAKGLTLLGAAEETFVLNPGESREVVFAFEAETAGEATLRFDGVLSQAVGAGESDGIETVLPIAAPLYHEVVATAAATGSAASEAIVVPPGARLGLGGIEIEASSTALFGLEEAVEYLSDYPYSCVEQQVSSILPWILAGDAVDAFGMSDVPIEEARRTVQAVLNKLPSYQDASGGFKYWTSSRTWHPYATAYVVVALVEAQRAGYSVDTGSLEAGLECLRIYLRKKRAVDSQYRGTGATLATEAFAVYALAVGGTPEPEQLQRLFENRELMPLFGRTFLLRAAGAGGAGESIRRELVREFNNYLRVEPTEAHFEEPGDSRFWWCWHTPTRTTAIVLGAILEAEGGHPMAAPIVRWLLSARHDGRWRNTQENVYAFDAIARYFSIYESEEPDFDAEVRLAGETVLRESFRGRSQQASGVTLSLDGLQRGIELPLEIEKTGTGQLYYTVRMTYYPTDPPPPRDEGFFIEKEIAPFDSTEGAGDSFEAGTLVVVRLRVVVPEWRTYVVVDDPLPAGLEAVNLSLKTESREVARAFADVRKDSWPVFEHVEMRDDRVLLFADWLDPGVHEFTYLARAITRGTFKAPAPTVTEMYTPEVFGAGASGWVRIR